MTQSVKRLPAKPEDLTLSFPRKMLFSLGNVMMVYLFISLETVASLRSETTHMHFDGRRVCTQQ